MHSFVERKLVERIGDAGRRLHTGRSRNEQVSLDLRLYLRRRIPAAAAARLQRWWPRAPTRPSEAGAALMPSYTHFRRAQPVLVAHFFLSHAAALRRDHARLAAAAEEANALTLGSGAIAGTSYPVDTERARPDARVLARRAQQHGRLVRSRLRRVVPVRRRRWRWCISAGSRRT